MRQTRKKNIYKLGKINIETKQWKNYQITKTFRNFKVNIILDHSNRDIGLWDRGAGLKSGPNKPLKIVFYKQLEFLLYHWLGISSVLEQI